MRKSSYLTILFFLLLFSMLNIVNVRADWEFVGSGGDWNYFNQYEWESPYGSTDSYFIYRTSISNFQHLGAIVYLENYDIGGYWEISKGHHVVEFILSDTEQNFVIVFHAEHTLLIKFLGFKVVQSGCTVLVNSLSEELPYLPVSRNMYIEFHAWKRNDGKLIVSYMYKWDYTENLVSIYEEMEVDVPSGWFNNVTIEQIIRKGSTWGGACYVKGGLANLTLTSGEGLSERPYTYEQATVIQTMRRNWWIVDTLFQIGSFLWSMLNLLWNFVIPNLPLLFSIYVFYLLYLVCLSLEDGDFGRLLDHFIKLGSFFVQIIQAIYQGVNTIISHFANLLRR